MKDIFYEPQRDQEQKIAHILLYNTEVSMHFHESVEILMVNKGEIHYHCNKHKHVLHEGEGVFIAPFMSHTFYSLAPSESETVIIPSKYLTVFSSLYAGTYFSKLNNKKLNVPIKSLFSEIERISQLQNPNPLLENGLANHLLGYIASVYPAKNFVKTDNIMVKICQYIDQHFHEKITLDDIAKAFNYNATYFSRMFNALFGCSLSFYINSVRCRYIENNHAFTNNKQSLNKTALIFDAGFESTSSYYRFINVYSKSKNKKARKNI